MDCYQGILEIKRNQVSQIDILDVWFGLLI